MVDVVMEFEGVVDVASEFEGVVNLVTGSMGVVDIARESEGEVDIVRDSKRSGRGRFCSMRVTLLLLSRSKALGPRCLALLAGAGAGPGAGAEEGVEGAEGAEGATGEGTRVPGPLSLLLDCRPPFLGAWSACPTIVTVIVTCR